MTTLDLPTARARRNVLPARTRFLCGLFFFSGFPALIYQLTWQRELFRIFGVNTESVTIVVTAFMLGLGLGSLAGGWISKRSGVRYCRCWRQSRSSPPLSGWCRSVSSNKSAR